MHSRLHVALEVQPPFILQELGGPIKITCTPPDNVNPIGWLKNNETINKETDGVMFLPTDTLKHTLYIADASIIHHNSTYSCGVNKSKVLIHRQNSFVYIRRLLCIYTLHTYVMDIHHNLMVVTYT